MTAHPLPAHVQHFFTRYLVNQKRVSAHTVASYRDTFRLLLEYAADRLGRQPVDMCVTDIDADLVCAFLSHVEEQRGNSVCTRNLRRTAIRTFFRFVAMREPALLLHCQQVLAIPAKLHDKRIVEFLDPAETAALLAAPDISTWIGRRDRTLLLVALQTGLRVSELTALNVGDVTLTPEEHAHLRCRGKGRKERATPLHSDSVVALMHWLRESGARAPDEPVFVTNRRGRFSRDGIERIVRKYSKMAAHACPSLNDKRVSPHTLRHTLAMDLLRNEVSCTVIALWLGHESAETTQIYLHADMEIKKRALDQTRPTDVPEGVYKPDDDILAFLRSL